MRRRLVVEATDWKTLSELSKEKVAEVTEIFRKHNIEPNEAMSELATQIRTTGVSTEEGIKQILLVHKMLEASSMSKGEAAHV